MSDPACLPEAAPRLPHKLLTLLAALARALSVQLAHGVAARVMLRISVSRGLDRQEQE